MDYVELLTVIAFCYQYCFTAFPLLQCQAAVGCMVL